MSDLMLRCRLLAFSACCCLWVSSMLSASVAVAKEHLRDYQIPNALFSETDDVPSDTVPPPQPDPNWHHVALPHNWDNAPYIVQGREGWYVFDYKLEREPKEIWAIYLPRLSMNLAVYLNGALLNLGGSFDEPISRNWNRPLFFVIPEHMLHAGTNRFSIRLKAYPHSGGGLGRVYLGPMRVLERNYKWHFRTFISTTIISCAMTVSLGLAMLLFWYLRKEPMFLWFALANFFSAFYLSNHFVQNIPVSRHVWEWLFHISIDAFSFCLMVFTHRWLEMDRKRWERALLVYVLASFGILFFLPDSYMMMGFNFNHAIFLLVGIYVVFLLFRAWRQQNNPWLLLPLLALLALFSLSIHDWQQLLRGLSNNDPYLMPLGEPLFLFVIGAFLVRYFVLAHRQAAHFAEELQEQVRLATEELEAQHRRVMELEQRRVVEEERKRILEELHDGIGGQLISAISLIDGGSQGDALRQTLQNALLDLRLVIDSLDEDTRDLGSLLGMLRFRLTPQLRARNVEMSWRIDPDAETCDLSYEVALNLLRIVQEAITNSLRHSGARHIEVAMEACPKGGLLISVADDGHGMGEHRPGRGLGHMRQRAKRIHAELEIHSDANGTRICVCLPSYDARAEEESPKDREGEPDVGVDGSGNERPGSAAARDSGDGEHRHR